MNLKIVDSSNFELVAGWLQQKENYQWLDFGQGHQLLPPAGLTMMIRQETNLIRLFTSDADEGPIGIAALSHITRNFKTAELWYLLGAKNFARQGYTTRAVHQILGVGFKELGIQAVSAWTLDTNTPSIRILQRNGFRAVGRQRKCHYIDGQAMDRLLFDLLANEYQASHARAAVA